MDRDDKMKLKELFKENRDKKWVFISPGGNQGDTMIYRGAYKLADETGLKYRVEKMGRRAEPPQIHGNEAIYIHGGGGWCTWWNWTPHMVQKITDKHPNNPIVIGPTTVALQRWYIEPLLPPKDTIFFAREQTSYNFLKELGVNVHLDHDTALHLTRDDKYLSPLLEGEKREPYKLAAVRVDAESPDTVPSKLIEEYDVVVDPCLEKNWGALHRDASEILTNRSHSAILGAILGKPTYMFRGKYHKNHSIYEYSLKQRGVIWVE